MKYILMTVLLVVPITAHAAWMQDGMPTVRVDTPHFVHSTQQIQHYTPPVVNHPQAVVRHERQQPDKHYQAASRHEPVVSGYFRRDDRYYGHDRVSFPYADVDTTFSVPDGYELVTVNDETFYYNKGVFYQEVNGQLTAVPAVPGAVVDYIPQDYQIVMADGVHYLFTGGVYYQRVEEGFEVVEVQDS